ncbi:MAG: O-antigen ligase family protein [Candidatus Humimicrobiaceae bacterium]
MFFVFSIPFFNYKKALNLYFKFTFFTFTVLSLFGLTEYLFEKTAFTIQKDPYAGKFFHAFNVTHNATGSVYSMVCIFALVFFLREKNFYKKIGYIFILAVCIIGLFITKSRGGYVGFAVALIFVLWMNYRSLKNFFISFAIIFVGSIPFLYITGAYKRILQIFDFKATTIVRFDLWERAWNLFSQSPIFGVGFGRYNDIFENSRLQGIRGLVDIYIDPNFTINDAHAHNAYLQFLSETGVLGLFLLLLFWCLCFYKLNRAFINTENEFSKKAYLCGLGAIVALLTISLTENYLSATTVMICVSIIIALCLGLIWQESKKNFHNQNQVSGWNLENENN